MSGLNNQSLNISPARNIPSPHLRTNPDDESEYLVQLLVEMQKLGPLKQVFPICDRLLDQEITRVSANLASKVFEDFDRLRLGNLSPSMSANMIPDVEGSSNWNRNGSSNSQLERFGGPQGMPMDLQTVPATPDSFLVKRVLCLDVPVDKYPNYNFIGRLLGPRGNSLKRVEASTGCRIFIRGKGSVKDPNKEEKLRGKPGFEHLNEPLHILIEAESPANAPDGRLNKAKEIIEELLIPVNESKDFYKKEQLRELAMLNNSQVRSPQPRGSGSPSTSSGRNHPKSSW